MENTQGKPVSEAELTNHQSLPFTTESRDHVATGQKWWVWSTPDILQAPCCSLLMTHWEWLFCTFYSPNSISTGALLPS